MILQSHNIYVVDFCSVTLRPTILWLLESGAGGVFKKTTLGDEFGFEDYLTQHGDTVLPLFIIKDTAALDVVVATGLPSPKQGQAVISLVGPA